MRRSLPAVVIAVITAGFLALTAHAQTAVLVSDLNPGLLGVSSEPSDFTSVGGKVYFTAEDPNGGRDLWTTDGTPEGTVWLAVICQSPCLQPRATLAGAGRLLFFDVVYGTDHQLWRTDGTRAGTSFLLADQAAGLTVAGDIAYFWAWMRHPPWGSQPWRSDGTPAGTAPLGALSLGEHDGPPRFAVLGSRVFVLARGPDGTAALWRCDDGLGAPAAVPHLSGGFRLLTSAGGRLFFLAGAGGGDGEELWSSDGTSAGTRRLTRFAPAEPFRLTRALVPGDRGVSFPADDGVHGLQVWTSNGTPAGTVQATPFTSADPFGGPEPGSAQAVEVGGRLFVIADGGAGFRLWVKAGRGFAAPLGQMEVSPYTGLLRIGGQVFFRADDGASGFEPWRSDGTAAGTRMLRDICPGVCNSQLTLPTALGGQAVFLARDPDHGAQIWTSDGTTAGTRRVTGLPEGAFAPASFMVAAAGRQLVFPASDSLHGEETWTAGGPALGGRLLADLLTAGYSSDPQHLTGSGKRLLFITCDGRRGLWSTEGTPETTVFLSPSSEVCPRSGAPMPLTAAGSRVFFRNGSTLWRTDGTPAGTVSLGVDASFLTSWNGLALFWHSGGLWTSDGTGEGTRKALDLPPEASALSALAVLGQDIYLLSDQGLFRADGLTSTIAWISPAPRADGLPRFTRAGSLVFFVAAGEDGEHVWRTDGTLAGTFPLPAFASPGESQKVVDLVEHQGILYFFVASDDGRILWRTDGTVAGTVILHDFGSEYDPTLDRLPSSGLTAAAGRLFFAARYGDELWTSDGTPEGTMRVAEVGPAGTGPSPSRPFGFIAAGGLAWFAAEDADHGRELWSSDGTAAGTHLVQDIAPGVASSSPQQLTLADGRLWLNADDGRTGRELWFLPLDSPGR